MRCMSPKVTLMRHATVSAIRPLSGVSGVRRETGKE